MFSYRHAFHAGNHADVLKHSIFVHILKYYNRKPGPYWVIDTHAGGGLYDLRHDWSTGTAEVADGLDRLLDTDVRPGLINDFIDEIEHLNPDGVANIYPGSPWLALQSVRNADRIRLFELHPSEAEILRQNVGELDARQQRQCMVYQDDGFKGLIGLLPPPPRRAITIIDPPYEDKGDYRKLPAVLDQALKRFATGCYLIWYPKVSRSEVTQMTRALEKIKLPWLHASLTVHKPAAGGHGLYGSGVFVVNPPWTLHAELALALPWLAKRLGRDEFADHTLSQNTV